MSVADPDPIPVITEERKPHTDDMLKDLYPRYKELRAAGPAVWLRHRIFSSYDGVALTRAVNRAFLTGTSLAADGDTHRHLRAPLNHRLCATEIRTSTSEVHASAQKSVAALVAHERCDAVAELRSVFNAERPALAHGVHGCAGATFSELLASEMLSVLGKYCARIELDGEPRRALDNAP